MPDITGDAIDRLITIEAKNRGMPHNVLPTMYEAARALAGGPVAMAAAQRLGAAIKPGDTVLILTGAGYPPTLPEGESDGPPGAASLARILYKGLGAVPVYCCEACHVRPIVASSLAAGVMIKDRFEDARDRKLGAFLSVAPTARAEVPAWVETLYAQTKPKAVISTERLGPAQNGIIHNATGQPLEGPGTHTRHTAVDLSPLVTAATQSKLLTIGIGDHGNEIGFGAIREAVVRAMPNGERLCTAIATDLVLPAMMSNWGCYGIEAALAFLLKRADLMHRPADEERILRACLGANGLEAMYCTQEFYVDGLDGETSMACVQILGNIVRKNLESATTGLTH